MSLAALASAAAYQASAAAPILAQVADDATKADSTANLSGIAGWAVTLIDALGGLGVALLVALENLFPPIPSEIILPLAGFNAKLGTAFPLWGAIVWATVGSVVGALALYLVGALLGRERTRAIMNWLPLVKVSDVDKTEKWFDDHGQATVFFGRMVPIFRSLISIPAGVTRMPIPRFLMLTTAGSLIWNTILIVAGYILGANWSKVEGPVSTLANIVLVLVAVAIVVWIVLRIRSNRREKEAGTAA